MYFFHIVGSLIQEASQKSKFDRKTREPLKWRRDLLIIFSVPNLFRPIYKKEIDLITIKKVDHTCKNI